jgi:hypothetical protein
MEVFSRSETGLAVSNKMTEGLDEKESNGIPGSLDLCGCMDLLFAAGVGRRRRPSKLNRA